MYEEILITQLNDFIFCPASIYFHMLYGDTERILYQSNYQINGTHAHKTIDNSTYSDRKAIITGIDVYCEEYGLIGKIDMYDMEKCILVERKRTIKKIYDGYIFQVYAQCLALREMGYVVNKIVIHSLTDNKNYPIKLPEKCRNCIYEPACDRGIR